MDKYLSLRAEKRVPREYTVSRGVPIFHEFSSSAEKAQIPFIKNREFDGFLGFLAGSYEGAYFGVRNRARFCQNAKKAQIIGF